MPKHSQIFWAIADADGLYCGTARTRLEAVAEFVHSRNPRTTESRYPNGRKLFTGQQREWDRYKKHGLRAVKVRVIVV